MSPVASLQEEIYRKWVEDNRAYVSKVSANKLGYVHVRDMSEAALAQLYLDLDDQNRARQGVVIDLRNNNGGFVNAYALDVLTRRPYLTMIDRNGPPASARTALGQRSLELPTILVINQHSLSPTRRTSPRATARSSSARWSASRPPDGSSTPVR